MPQEKKETRCALFWNTVNRQQERLLANQGPASQQVPRGGPGDLKPSRSAPLCCACRTRANQWAGGVLWSRADCVKSKLDIYF